MVSVYDTYDPETPRVHRVAPDDHPDLMGINPDSVLVPFTHANAPLIHSLRQQTPYVFLLPEMNYRAIADDDDQKRLTKMLHRLGSYVLMDSSMYKAVQSMLLWQQLTQPGETELECMVRLCNSQSSPLHTLLVTQYPEAATTFVSLGLDPYPLLLTYPMIGHPTMWNVSGLPTLEETFIFGLRDRIVTQVDPGDPLPTLTEDEYAFMMLEHSEPKPEKLLHSNNLTPIAWVHNLAFLAWARSMQQDPWAEEIIYELFGLQTPLVDIDHEERVDMSEFVFRLAVSAWLAFDYPNEYHIDEGVFEGFLGLKAAFQSVCKPSIVKGRPDGAIPTPSSFSHLDNLGGYWTQRLPHNPFDTAIANVDYRAVARDTPLDIYLFGTTKPPHCQLPPGTVPGPTVNHQVWSIENSPFDEGPPTGDSND